MEKKQYTKLEHYVPKCYLKNFSLLENDNYFIYCLFQNSTTIKRININNVCAINDLYELEIFEGYVDRNDIEDGFIDMESKYADFCREHLSQIDRCQTIVLSSTNLELIKEFCVFLFFRSKHMIDLLIEFCENYIKHNPANWSNIRKEIKSVDSKTLEIEIIPYLDKCLSYELAYRLMKNMLNTRDLSIEVMALKKTFGSNYCFLYSENNDFITSDTPVVSIHGTKAQYLGFKSLICVPLTTNCCIAFLENKKYNGQIISLTPKQVDDVNLAQASKDYGLLISKKEKWIDRYFLNKKALGS